MISLFDRDYSVLLFQDFNRSHWAIFTTVTTFLIFFIDIGEEVVVRIVLLVEEILFLVLVLTGSRRQ